MATVNKNFRIKNGLIVEGTSGTINGQNILTETGSDQYILDLVGGTNLIDSVASGLSVTSAELSIDRTVVDTWYDPAGAAATAQSNAEDYADGLAANYDPAGTAAGLAANYDPAGAASTAEDNANTYTDNLIGDLTVDGTSGNTVTARIATAVANLVDSAPAALDTLNELAAALGDNVDGMTGIATAIGNKLPLAGGTMSGNIAMGNNNITGVGTPSANDHAATKGYVDTAASTAQTNAEDYADGLASNYDAAGSAATAQSNAEGYADDIVGNLISGDTAFTAVNVNSVAGIWAATTTVVSPSTNTAWAFNSAVFTSAKLLVSIKANGHSQVSEVLVTLDSAGNVAVTEFGMVGTNGSLGEVTAINSSGNISIRVTTSYANSDVIVYATTLV